MLVGWRLVRKHWATALATALAICLAVTFYTLGQTKIYQALKGVRGRKPVDLAGLEQLLVRFSQLVAEQRWIKEIEINPLLASPEHLLALHLQVVPALRDGLG